MPETPLVESDLHGRRSVSFIVQRFELSRRNVSDRFEQSSVIEPVDPFEGRELNFFKVAPRAVAPDDLGLEEPEDRLGQGVVVGIAQPSASARKKVVGERQSNDAVSQRGVGSFRQANPLDPVVRILRGRFWKFVLSFIPS